MKANIIHANDDKIIFWHELEAVPRVGDKLSTPYGQFRVVSVEHYLYGTNQQELYIYVKG
jgi:hypothetical protein